MSPLDLTQNLRQRLDGDRGRCDSDVQAAACRMTQRSELRARLVVSAKDNLGVRKQRASRVAEKQLLVDSEEQRRAELIFELADMNARRRLGEVHSRGGEGERASLGDGFEGS